MQGTVATPIIGRLDAESRSRPLAKIPRMLSRKDCVNLKPKNNMILIPRSLFPNPAKPAYFKDFCFCFRELPGRSLHVACMRIHSDTPIMATAKQGRYPEEEKMEKV